MQEVYEFLKACNVYYLATVEGDQPHVRPFGTVDLFEGKLYIQTGKVKAVAQQMLANPKVEISAMSADGRWIRISATAVEDDNVAAQAHMLDAYPSLKGMYTAGDGNTMVLYLKDATAQICSFGAPARLISF